MLWFLAQPLHYRLCELFGSDLLLANTFFVNVVGMDAVLNCAQPGIVNALGDVRLTDVYEHEYGAMEQTGRIGEILPGAARRGAVNGFKHGALVANIGRTRQAYGTGDLGGNIGENV